MEVQFVAGVSTVGTDHEASRALYGGALRSTRFPTVR